MLDLAHDIRMTLNRICWRKNVKSLPSFTQCYDGRYYVTLRYYGTHL